ncbi:MAG: aminotransferase class III-fold pyridoxal phosphate-dependent enzyme [Flavobacteriales bacterium]
MTNAEYSDRLHRLIPGGAHTYSRGDDQFPSNAPAILSHGKGAYVWDHAGRELLDYGMALRSVTLGYAHPEVNAAALAAMEKGNGLTRASLIELEAAEAMLSYFPWADMVKFAKNGSTVTTAAVKLARAFTGRAHVAVCAQHPFFSYDDWFIGSTAMKRGSRSRRSYLQVRLPRHRLSGAAVPNASGRDRLRDHGARKHGVALVRATNDDAGAGYTPRQCGQQFPPTGPTGVPQVWSGIHP